MRKIHLLVSFCLFSAALAAQQKIDRDAVIELDLLSVNGPFPSNFIIKENARLRYRITNINRHVYSIGVNSEARAYFSERPAIFGLISNIDLSKLSPAIPANAAGSGGTPLEKIELLSSNSPDQTIIDDYRAAKSAANTAIQDYYNYDQKIRKIASLYRTLNAAITDGITPFTTLYADKQASTNRLLATEFSYTGPADNDLVLQPFLRDSTEMTVNEQAIRYNALLQHFNILKQKQVSLEGLFTSKLDQLKRALSVAAPPRKSAIATQISSISNELLIERLIIDGITTVIADIKTAQLKITEYQGNGFSQAVAFAFQRITLANWQYISPSILGEKDEVKVTFAISAKDATVPTPSYEQFNGDVKGQVYGFKLNFSTGIFILAGEKLFDKSYRVDTISGDLQNNVIVENDHRESVQPAVGALMHFYIKRPGSFSWGGNIGFSVSSETRLNYHGGLSFLFGQQQRIILNGGVAVSHVKEIGSAYRDGQLITRSSGITTIPTDNFYRAGFFAAVTFNLSN